MQQQAECVDHNGPEPNTSRPDAIDRFSLSNTNNNAADHSDADDQPKLLLVTTDHVHKVGVTNHHPVGQSRHSIRKIGQPERTVITSRLHRLIRE